MVIIVGEVRTGDDSMLIVQYTTTTWRTRDIVSIMTPSQAHIWQLSPPVRYTFGNLT